jgi:hypothetical protein
VLKRLRLIGLLACALAACGRSPIPSGAASEDGAAASTRARAVAWLATARFEDADRTIECQPDCKEQERGFDYARKARIEQPGDCDLARVQAHASEDFIEGCRAYGQFLEAAGRGR